MRQRALSGVLTLAVSLSFPGLPAAAGAQVVDTSKIAVSVDRIKKALETQPEVELTQRRPDFSVSITETLVYDNPFGRDEKRKPSDWQAFFMSETGSRVAGPAMLAAATASLAGSGTMSAKPIIGVDLLYVATVLEGKVRAALRNRKSRKVREEVRRELEEFCAARGCTPP